MNDAEKHAEIAKRVYPDADIATCSKPHNLRIPCSIANGAKYIYVDGIEFNLLVTNSDGTPTTQAKSDCFDVIMFLLTIGGNYKLGTKNPTKAIFNAAWEVVKDE